MNRDISELKERVDLAALVKRDLGSACKRRNRWWFWHCSFHDDRNPSLGVTPDNGRWTCFGCGESGDHVDWLTRYHGLSVGDAIGQLEHLASMPAVARAAPTCKPVVRPDDGPPSPAWQEAARTLVKSARKQLWAEAGQPGLAYLRTGGLTDETIRHWGLGWNPANTWLEPKHWGIDEGKKLWVPRGIVIPCEIGGTLWYVKVRRFDGDGRPAGEGNKYIQLKGSKTALFGADCLRADGRPLLLCEGERDCLLTWQEIGGLVDAATLGGAGKRHLGRWRLWLLPYKQVLVVYDSDTAGRCGAASLEEMDPRTVSIPLPHGSDLTDFHVNGGDLRTWLACYVHRVKGKASLKAEAAHLLRENSTEHETQLHWCKRYGAIMAELGITCTGHASWADWVADVEADLVSQGTAQEPMGRAAFKGERGLCTVSSEWIEGEACPTVFPELVHTGFGAA